MKVRYAKLHTISDARGTVLEPLDAAELCNQKNAHVVTSKPEVVRGNHYHVKGQESIIVIGPVLVRFRENGRNQDIEVAEGEVYRFVFPPKVPHAIKNMGDGNNVLVAFNTEPHDPDRPDTVREELL
jgi:dTDP-4-dehydrorhamnose 3,5-epimerase-like enzyme